MCFNGSSVSLFFRADITIFGVQYSNASEVLIILVMTRLLMQYFALYMFF